MKLVHKSEDKRFDGMAVAKGDVVRDFRGDLAVVTGWCEPHNSSSTGRIQVEEGGHCAEYYPSVYGCEWVEREDR